jgi:hypothetical protein
VKTEFVTVSLWTTPIGPCITLDLTRDNLQPECPIRYPITHNEACMWARWANEAKAEDKALCGLLNDGWTLAVPLDCLPKNVKPYHSRMSPTRRVIGDYDLYVDLNSKPLFRTHNP